MKNYPIKSAIYTFVAATTFATYSASAQSISRDVTFTGNIPTQCEFGTSTNGSLLLDTGTNVLGSSDVGGIDGSISVTTNGGALLSVSGPSLVGSSPANAVLDTASSTSSLTSGSLTITNSDGSVTLDNAGTETFDVAVSLISNTTTFPAGDYEALVTVTCEFDASQLPGS
jgi:hypothetical protein